MQFDTLSPRDMIAAVYFVMSCVTFVAYGWDKRRAIRHASRVPEHTLHLLELLGGWPGALIAMSVFRHKTVKGSFRLVTFAIVLLHCAGWAWFLSRDA